MTKIIIPIIGIALCFVIAYFLYWTVSIDLKPVIKCTYQNQKTTLSCDDNGVRFVAVVRGK